MNGKNGKKKLLIIKNKMKDEKTKTMYELDLNETLAITTNIGGKVEITRVPGGWVYSFEYVGFRTSPIVFVPYNTEYSIVSSKKMGTTQTKKKQ